MNDIVLFFIVSIFLMSASDLFPKRNWFRRVNTITKLNQWLVALILLVLVLITNKEHNLKFIIALRMCFYALIFNGLVLRKYLPGSPKRILDGKKTDVTILALNVRQKNKEYDRAKTFLQKEDPDIVALTETNKEWVDALSTLDDLYPYRVKVPLENSYGMMFLSKLEIMEHEVRYLVSDDVPSIHAIVKYNSQELHVMLIHPKPPVNFSSLRNKDLEILKMTVEERKTEVPTILCGDLNDVGWSYASRHMCQQTNLEDPRIGRGFFNTYNAHIPLFRYPIDHFFLSPSLKVVNMQVLEKCGSDHFPVSISIEIPNTTIEH